MLPRRFGWLLPLVPCEAANRASQLRHLLGEPEMQALLGASPQARRVLAPLCRMLGIEAALLTGGVARVVEAPPEQDRPARSGKVSWRGGVPPGLLEGVQRVSMYRVRWVGD